jgi:hypothetical protein
MKHLPAIKLTNNQKSVLAIIANNANNPLNAAQQLTNGANIIGARNLLMKLGTIEVTIDSAKLTDKGQVLAQQNNITDEGGNLTDLGRSLLPQDGQQPDNQDSIDIDTNTPGMGDQGMTAGPPMDSDDLFDTVESFSPLFKSFLFD